jgi:UDP-glucose 4-epimerase
VNRRNESLVDYYRRLKVLVTGGASFIGSALVELLLQSGAEVTVADNLSSGLLTNLESVNDDIAFLQGDLRDRDFSRRAALGQEVVFHLAAAHGGRGYIDSHPVECTNNMLLDHVVFAAAASSGVAKLVLASSACVYPTHLQAEDQHMYLLRESDANFDEPAKAFADGEYGWAKLMGELQLRAFHRQYRMDGIACRIFTAYGERENETHAVIALIAKAFARFDPFPIWGNGLQTRNFTYVADTAYGMALAGARLGGFHTINLGTDKHHTINELVAEIFNYLGWHPDDFDYQLDKPVGVRNRASDNSKIKQLLGWSPHTGLKEGLQRTIDWYNTVATPRRLSELATRMVKRDAEFQQTPG